MGKKVVRVVMERGQFEFNSEKDLFLFPGGSGAVRVQFEFRNSIMPLGGRRVQKEDGKI
jgi:hypothetical protein